MLNRCKIKKQRLKHNNKQKKQTQTILKTKKKSIKKTNNTQITHLKTTLGVSTK